MKEYKLVEESKKKPGNCANVLCMGTSVGVWAPLTSQLPFLSLKSRSYMMLPEAPVAPLWTGAPALQRLCPPLSSGTRVFGWEPGAALGERGHKYALPLSVLILFVTEFRWQNAHILCGMPLSHGLFQKWNVETPPGPLMRVRPIGDISTTTCIARMGCVGYCKTPKVCKDKRDKNGGGTHVCSPVPSQDTSQLTRPTSGLVGKWPSSDHLLTVQRWVLQTISTITSFSLVESLATPT